MIAVDVQRLMNASCNSIRLSSHPISSRTDSARMQDTMVAQELPRNGDLSKIERIPGGLQTCGEVYMFISSRIY